MGGAWLGGMGRDCFLMHKKLHKNYITFALISHHLELSALQGTCITHGRKDTFTDSKLHMICDMVNLIHVCSSSELADKF